MTKQIKNMFKPAPMPKGIGNAGYDSGTENIDPHVKTQAFSTKEVTLSDGAAAGWVKNDANGVLSGGNPGGAGDVTASTNLTDETIVQGDGGAKGIKTSTATVAEIASNTSARHTQDTDTALGSGCVAADHGTAATDMVVNVCYGTGAPPAANTTTIGSIYLTYTA